MTASARGVDRFLRKESVKFLARPGPGHVEQVELFLYGTSKALEIGWAQFLFHGDQHFVALELLDYEISVLLRVPVVEGDNGHRELQPLGLVDGHDAHGINVFGQGNLFLVGFFFPEVEEGRERAVSVLFGQMDYFEEAAHVEFRFGVSLQHTEDADGFPWSGRTGSSVRID